MHITYAVPSEINFFDVSQWIGEIHVPRKIFGRMRRYLNDNDCQTFWERDALVPLNAVKMLNPYRVREFELIDESPIVIFRTLLDLLHYLT